MGGEAVGTTDREGTLEIKLTETPKGEMVGTQLYSGEFPSEGRGGINFTMTGGYGQKQLNEPR